MQRQLPVINGAFRGLSLFCDVTIANPLSGTGIARNQSHVNNGDVVERAANHKKDRTYNDIHRSPSCKFLVLGCETYGRWCCDALRLIGELAYYKSLDCPQILRKSVQAAWTHRWWSIISIGVARAVAQTSLCTHGPDLITGIGSQQSPTIADLFD